MIFAERMRCENTTMIYNVARLFCKRVHLLKTFVGLYAIIYSYSLILDRPNVSYHGFFFFFSPPFFFLFFLLFFPPSPLPPPPLCNTTDLACHWFINEILWGFPVLQQRVCVILKCYCAIYFSKKSTIILQLRMAIL